MLKDNKSEDQSTVEKVIVIEFDPEPQIFTLNQAPFPACLIAEGEGLRYALSRADAGKDGDQNGPDLEGLILQSLNDGLLSGQRADIDWKACEFCFSEFDPSEQDDQLCDGWVVSASGHPRSLSHNSDRTVSSNSKYAWHQLVEIFLSEISASRCSVLAKRDSPFNPLYEHISLDAWRHFSILDWERGTARSLNGEFLFSIMIVFDKPDRAVELLNVTKPKEDSKPDEIALELENLTAELDKIIKENRARPAVRKLIGFFYKKRPDISIDDIIDQNMMREIAAFPGITNPNRMTSNKAKKAYAKMRDLEREITKRNMTMFYNDLRAFLDDKN